MYIYYQPVANEEHMLYASEISTLYGIVTESGKPASRVVSHYLKKYCVLHKIMPLFYPTKNGLTQVYSREIYANAMREFISNAKYQTLLEYSINNKKFKFMIKERWE